MSRITSYSGLPATLVAGNDLLPIVDVDDFTMAGTGTTKNVSVSALLAGSLSVVAATPVAGVALVNGTPTILTWSVPNDGQQHRCMVFASNHVTTAPQTGGAVSVSATLPDSFAVSYTLVPGGNSSTGFNFSQFTYPIIVKPGSTVTVQQGSAQTAGAETVWAEIWGS
jgi:hypothetical protein